MPRSPGGQSTEPLGTRSDWFSTETEQNPRNRLTAAVVSGAAVAASAPTPPERVGIRYRLLEQVHQSAMGAVWRAVDEVIGTGQANPTPVAVKLIPQALAPAFDAKTLAGLVRLSRRPGMVTLLMHGTQDGWWYQVARWLDGTTLEALLQSPPDADYVAANIPAWIRQVSRSLEAQHRAGFVHGDVKPANVMIAGGEAQLIDLAGLRTGASWTRHGGLTPAFASPEAMRGAPADPRDDVYSLAVMAFQLLTGNVPFPGGRNPNQASPPRAGLSDSQWHALRRALDADRECRATSTTDLVDALWPVHIELPTSQQSPIPMRRSRSAAPGWHVAATVMLAAVILGVSAQLSDRLNAPPSIVEKASPPGSAVANTAPMGPRVAEPELRMATPMVEPISPLPGEAAAVADQALARADRPASTAAPAPATAMASAPAPEATPPGQSDAASDAAPTPVEPLPAQPEPIVVADAPGVAAPAPLDGAGPVDGAVSGDTEPLGRDIALPLNALILGLPGLGRQQQQSDPDPYVPEPNLALVAAETLQYQPARFTDPVAPLPADPISLPAATASLQARVSSRPSTPVPDRPSTPDTPAVPDRPSTPDRPAVPDRPSTPDRPAVPDRPTTPDRPAVPDRPSVPDRAAAPPPPPNRPAVPAKPARPDRPATPARPSRPNKPAKPNVPRPPGRGGG